MNRKPQGECKRRIFVDDNRWLVHQAERFPNSVNEGTEFFWENLLTFFVARCEEKIVAREVLYTLILDLVATHSFEFFEKVDRQGVFNSRRKLLSHVSNDAVKVLWDRSHSLFTTARVCRRCKRIT